MNGQNEPGRDALVRFAWKLEEVGEAIELLARRSGFLRQGVEPPLPAESVAAMGEERVGAWIESVAQYLGLAALAVEGRYDEAERLVRGLQPGLLRLSPTVSPDTPRFLAVWKQRRNQAMLLAPDGTVQTVPVSVLRAALCAEVEAAWTAQVTALLQEAALPTWQEEKARAALLRQLVGHEAVGGCWLVSLLPDAPVWQQVRHSGLGRDMVGMAGTYLLGHGLYVAGWWIVGQGALASHMDQGWLLAWLLILFTAIPFHLWNLWLQGKIATVAGMLFKLRLMWGTLNLELDAIRHQGAGQFLGRVMEAEAVELLALGGGFRVLFGLVELTTALLLLTQGVGGGLHALLLGGWLLVTLGLSVLYWKRGQGWIVAYQEMTNEMVEQMLGHRTRVVQEGTQRWHEGEDQQLDRYLKLSEQRDRLGVWLTTLVPRGWLLLGFLGVVAGLVGPPASLPMLASSLAGMLLAHQALEGLVTGIQNVVGLLLAWQRVGPIYHARQAAIKQPPLLLEVQAAQGGASDEPLLLVKRLLFRYPHRTRPVIREGSLRIKWGERVLLEGPSGSGKSTLVSLLTGLREPESGLILLWGLDPHTMGSAAWRQRLVAAHQFHDNHIFTATLAFNLLMGRGWPPSAADLREAEAVCREVGLGPLLDAMPLGLEQVIGDGGWQLSHGERSRLYTARAILQRADLVVLDESFTALDPESAQQVLACLLKRVPTLLVVAHLADAPDGAQGDDSRQVIAPTAPGAGKNAPLETSAR